MTRSTWSGGVVWGDGTPAGDPTDAYWMPDGATASGPLIPDVAIGATLYTDDVSAASWTLGISGFLADLSPNTASITLVGQVTGVPGDDVVISTPLGVQWAGRLDTVSQTRDTAGDWWTTVTATDRLGALGKAEASGFTLLSYALTGRDRMDLIAEGIAEEAGVVIDIVDDSVIGLDIVEAGSGTYADPYTGSVLAYINALAKSCNVMLAMTRDGRFSAVIREAVTPSSVLTLSGDDAPQEWSLTTSVDVDINRWRAPFAGSSDASDIALYGERLYDAQNFDASAGSFAYPMFTDWWAYGGSQRPVASGTMTVRSWTQEDLILLDPFQWVTESGTAWQVMSVTHNVTVDGPWTVTITADNLLDLL